MRDITLEDTVYFAFTTRAFATGIPTTLAGSPVLSVLESNNATPITAGVSVQVDRASVTGLNQATVVATAANGYEVGKSYGVYISTGTVGGVSVVGEVVADFTIQASAAAVDLANGTDGLGAIKTETAAILADTGTDGVVVAAASKTGYTLSSAGIQAVWDALTAALTTAGSVGKLLVDNLNATISSRSTYAGTDTAGTTTLLTRIVGTLATGTHEPQTGDAFGRIGATGSGLTTLASQASVSALNNVSAAQVNAEVVDALTVDTYAEPGQGAPLATTSLAEKLNYLYKGWRNRSTQTATTYSLYNDDATTVGQKSTVSDNGTTYDRGEVATGP